MLDDNDMRWQAVLEYNTDDDGIWLVADARDRRKSERINLGFWPTVGDVVDAAERLASATDDPQGSSPDSGLSVSPGKDTPQ